MIRAQLYRYCFLPYLFRSRVVSRENFDEMFPDFEGEPSSAALGFGIGDREDVRQVLRNSPDMYNDKQGGNRWAKNNVVFVEWQYWERKKYYRIAFPAQDKVTDVSAEMYELAETKQLIEEAGAKVTEATRRCFYRAYYTGDEEIEHEELPEGQPSFAYKFITGRYDPEKGMFYGIVRPMLDPSNWTNKFFASILQVVSSNSKGGILYEEGVFKNLTEALKNWSDPSGAIPVADGALTNKRIEQRQPAAYPAGLHQLMDFTTGLLPRISGLSPEFMGQAMVNQPGILEHQRKQSGLAILAWLFDAMRAYRKDKARLMLFYIEHYLPPGRLVRIVGEKAAKYVPLALQPGTAVYDVVLENAPTSPNQKQATFALLMQLMPVMQKAGIPIVPEIFEYSELPAALVESFRQAMTKKPDPEQEAMKQQQMMLMVKQALAEIAKDESQAEYNRARAEETIASIDTERLKVAADIVDKTKPEPPKPVN